MFGESESESPRVPSPWDDLISNPPSPSPSTRVGTPLHSLASTSAPSVPSSLSSSTTTFSTSSDATITTMTTAVTKGGYQLPIPKLVPEVEEGNVEYKLQLLNPSPARFARLVTQMRWRLLEGGGQAYYELGVADSGALVGLPRKELEQSLETLEMMAGEIGASVIVVKEIEVPAALSGLASSMTDHWNLKRGKTSEGGDEQFLSLDGHKNGGRSESESPESSSREMDSATTDCTTDEDAENSAWTSSSVEKDYQFLHRLGGQDSSENEDNSDAGPTNLFVDLKISSVFKPRPSRRRPQATAGSGVKIGKFAMGQKKKLLKMQHSESSPSSHQQNPAFKKSPPFDNGDEKEDEEEVEQTQTKQQAKAIHRRQARDKKREQKRKALMTQTFPTSVLPAEVPPDPLSVNDEVLSTTTTTGVLRADEIDEITNELGELHVPVTVEPPSSAVQTAKSAETTSVSELSLDSTFRPSDFKRPFTQTNPNTALRIEDDDERDDIGIFPSRSQVGQNSDYLTVPSAVSTLAVDGGGAGDDGEPKLIVEALVVRKMSLEESFLDFGGFSLL